MADDKLLLCLNIVITGFVVVFAVLILLIILISIYGAIVNGIQKASKKNKDKKEKSEPVVKKEMPVVINKKGVSDEVVAVISAAVYSVYGSSQNVRIKSIKKSKSARSPWANAGVLNNTRPF